MTLFPSSNSKDLPCLLYTVGDIVCVWHGCVGFFVAILIDGIPAGCPFGRFLFGNRFIICEGVVSDSLYLWDLPPIRWLMRWGYLANCKGYVFPVLFILTLFVSLGLAMASYLIFERPFLIPRMAMEETGRRDTRCRVNVGIRRKSPEQRSVR
jgi:peptidoglycan/LPS O-acetylase OafA/YrhL